MAVCMIRKKTVNHEKEKYVMRFLTTALTTSIVMASLFASTPVKADDSVLALPQGQALLHISATEQKEVKQDTLLVRLQYQSEDKSAEAVQREINSMMTQALEMLGSHEKIKVETTSYNVYQKTLPRTKEQIWHGSQGLQLKSKEDEALLAVAGQLQERGFVSQGVDYVLTAMEIADIKDKMMEDALMKLSTRADRAAKALGKTSASLIEINVQGGHDVMPMVRSMGRMNMMAMESAPMPAPVAAAGDTTLSLTVSAKALLKP